jgi:hypothetical protein
MAAENSESVRERVRKVVYEFDAAAVVDKRADPTWSAERRPASPDQMENVEYERLTIASGVELVGHGSPDLLVPARPCKIAGRRCSSNFPYYLACDPWAPLEIETDDGEPVEIRCIDVPFRVRCALRCTKWLIRDAEQTAHTLGQ